ncbi:MAG: dihydropteroate synthase [Holosporaceae bacterium]|jgi:2-amino-4-hydroxy-6-hydroxymethyldihydropteridine diphosphokinase/dihydropteroate synthase|nr:dihydropteroate synthase [Holosporaceae bacterium]
MKKKKNWISLETLELEYVVYCYTLWFLEKNQNIYVGEDGMANKIYLSLGSNLGNRFRNLRTAREKLRAFFTCNYSSLVIETEALLPQYAPAAWNLPYLNAVLVGTSHLDPFSLLQGIKNLEKEMGRELDAPHWSPRIIDIDISAYGDLFIDTTKLCLPHREIKNRIFLQYLLESLGYEIKEENRVKVNDFNAINYFAFDPKLVGIVNVTPDSFSDGGKYFGVDAAANRIEELRRWGAYVIELGAQSTRPNYVEISPLEEISRLDRVFEKIKKSDDLGVDTYFDDVVQHIVSKYRVSWINDVRSHLKQNTIKLLADNNIKLVIMLYGTDLSWFMDRTKQLQNLGIMRENIVIDPGIGFGKSRSENIAMIRNISSLKEMGYEMMLAHSRKSFISSFSNATVSERDVETLSISAFATEAGIDYLRVHNLEYHMKFFVAQAYARRYQ